MAVGKTKEKTLSTTLVKNSYGKSVVRLTKVTRSSKPPTWKEITVETELFGDFADCYYDGDNTKIVATDSMRNTIYILGAKHSLDSIEDYGIALAKHFLSEYSHVTEAIIRIVENVWGQIPLSGKHHPTSFVKTQGDDRVAAILVNRKEAKIESGIVNLNVAKITDSEFSGFIRDKYTTLGETSDRIFGTTIDAHWKYKRPAANFNCVYETARKVMLETFADHHSLSAQQTLYAMGDAVLEAVDDIEEISLILPNLHRLTFDLRPFGMENTNEIFVSTSEPYGTIKGTIARKK